MTPRNKYIFIDAICGLLVLLFVYSGVSKLWSHADFETQTRFFIPYPFFSRIISYTVPLAELFTAVLLAVNITKRAGMYAFICIMSLFSLYIILMLHSGKNLPCTCGGVIGSMSWKQHLLFNAGFIIIAMAGLLIHSAKATYLQMKK